MPSLSDLVHVIPPDKDDEPEDIFASAPGLIFTDDLSNIHGDPDSVVVYQSKRFGNIELRTADPMDEYERRLFSHYVWNASIKLAELLSTGGSGWSVHGETVLELGAGMCAVYFHRSSQALELIVLTTGAGLGGIVATLAGAREVVMTDYPSPVVLANLRRNAENAIRSHVGTLYRVEGHTWGELDDVIDEQEHHFQRIIAADCFWMPAEHSNLVRSMLHFLTLDPGGRIFAIAGFHTGRAKVAAFFDCAVEEGLEMEEIYEEDDQGFRREWAKERDGGREDHTLRKRWLVVARLKRRACSL